jgi:catechol 2,3-dioxygenase-like lactoylglutathione lyase family enzyme
VDIKPAHLSINVKDSKKAKEFFDYIFERKPDFDGEVSAGKPYSFHSSFYRWKGFAVEFIGPTEDGSSTMLQDVLDKYGERIHHICFSVDPGDMDKIIKKLQDRGIKLLTEKGQPAELGAKNIYTHPKATQGVVYQFLSRDMELEI